MKPVNQPGLAADFRGHPSRCVRDVRQGETQQERPQCPARLEQLATPQQECLQQHQQREVSSQSRHDVVAVKKKRKRRRPLVARNLVQPFHFGPGRAVNQKAQHIVDHDGIVDGCVASSGCPISTIGAPACELNSPSMAAMLPAGVWPVSTVQVSGRENLGHASYDSGDHPDADEDPAVLGEPVFQQVKCPDG